MASIPSFTTNASATAALRFPFIDPKDPAESFFKLIRARDWQGAQRVMGDKRIINALITPCAQPTFSDQTIAEKQMERFLVEVGDPERVEMAYQIALTLDCHGKKTPFATIVELIALFQKSASDGKEYAKDLLKSEYFINAVNYFAKDCYGNNENIRPLFEELVRTLEGIEAKG